MSGTAYWRSAQMDPSPWPDPTYLPSTCPVVAALEPSSPWGSFAVAVAAVEPMHALRTPHPGTGPVRPRLPALAARPLCRRRILVLREEKHVSNM